MKTVSLLILLCLSTVCFGQTAEQKQEILDDIDALRAKVDSLVIVDVAPDPEPGPVPTTPSGLSADSSTGSIVVSWQSSVLATGYRLYRYSDGEDISLLVETALLTHTDSSALVDIPYSYVIVAYNTDGPSPSSTPQTAEIVSGNPDPPANTLVHGVPDVAEWPGTQVVEYGQTANLTGTLGVVAVKGDAVIDSTVSLLTLVVYPSGKLTVNPGADITILDQAIDLNQDPMQWGHGVVCAGGEWNINGTSKRPMARALGGIAQGATTILLSHSPDGWNVGDILYLPQSEHWGHNKSVEEADQFGNTPQVPHWFANDFPAGTSWKKDSRIGEIRWEKMIEFRQDERIAISAINGQTVTLATATQFEHPPAIDADGATVFHPGVLNITRDIVFRSENGDGVRGHTAATGRSKIDHKYASFINMGRTKLKFPIEGQYGGTLAQDQIGIDPVTNPAGRYSWHMHHMIGRENPSNTGYQFKGEGLFVDDAPKWGFTLHGSHYGRLKDCTALDCFDGGYVTEDGSEQYNEFTSCHVGGITRRGFWLVGHHNSVTNCISHGSSTGFYIGVGNGMVTVMAPTARGQEMSQYVNWKYAKNSFVAFDGCEHYGGGEAFGIGRRVGQWFGSSSFPDATIPVVTDFKSWHNHRMSSIYGTSSLVIDGFTHISTPDTLTGFNNRTGFTSNGSSTADLILRNGKIHNCVRGVRLRSRGDARLNLLENIDFKNEIDIYREPWTRDGFENTGITHRIVDCTLRGDLEIDCSWTGSKSIYTLARDEMFIEDGTAVDQVFFTQQAPSFVLPTGLYYRTEDNQIFNGIVDGLTNQEAWDQHGVAIFAGVATSTTPVAKVNGFIGPVFVSE